jgi:hypothetical protein
LKHNVKNLFVYFNTFLLASLTKTASARVDWQLERHSEGSGGKELLFGGAVIALMILFSIYQRYWGQQRCSKCLKKVRVKAKYCSHCGATSPTE